MCVCVCLCGAKLELFRQSSRLLNELFSKVYTAGDAAFIFHAFDLIFLYIQCCSVSQLNHINKWVNQEKKQNIGKQRKKEGQWGCCHVSETERQKLIRACWGNLSVNTPNMEMGLVKQGTTTTNRAASIKGIQSNHDHPPPPFSIIIHQGLRTLHFCGSNRGVSYPPCTNKSSKLAQLSGCICCRHPVAQCKW